MQEAAWHRVSEPSTGRQKHPHGAGGADNGRLFTHRGIDLICKHIQNNRGQSFYHQRRESQTWEWEGQ